MNFFHIACLFLLTAQFNSSPGIGWKNREFKKFAILYTEKDSASVQDIGNILIEGMGKIEDYFDMPLADKFEVNIFPSRNEMDAQWSKDWNYPGFKSDCWMVAGGTANKLDLLSPGNWRYEACEHDPADKDHIRKILTHELVHVFHGQHNPVGNFSGLDDIGWFVEGLAVLVSGQMDEQKINGLREAKNSGKLPVRLAEAWNGKYRYSVSGSLVRFVGIKFGKEMLKKLLVCKTNAEILVLLRLSEKDLLYDWKNSI
jgi:hypothetical protein